MRTQARVVMQEFYIDMDEYLPPKRHYTGLLRADPGEDE
jgi:hypothetical protein